MINFPRRRDLATLTFVLVLLNINMHDVRLVRIPSHKRKYSQKTFSCDKAFPFFRWRDSRHVISYQSQHAVLPIVSYTFIIGAPRKERVGRLYASSSVL